MLSFLLLVFAVSVTCSSAIGSKCIEDQQVSLLNKKSLVFNASSSSTKLVSWNSSTDCCSWLGITCSDDGSVTGLDINNESISGGIDNSSSLFHLQHLRSLNLAHNILGGGHSRLIPSAVGQLKNLRYLNLSNSCYLGQIPIEISYLARLVILDTSDNELILESPNLHMLVQNLTELTELHNSRVQISSRETNWSHAISSSPPNLRVLDMSNCGVSGPIHESLANLQSLSVVQLTGNDISAPVPRFFANFSNLAFLGLSLCNLQGIFP